MKRKLAATCAASLLLLAGAGVFTGCENDHSLTGDEFYLSPSSYRFVRTNEFVVSIGAHGGVMPLRWEVSDTSLGHLTGVVSGTNYNTVSTANYVREENAYGVNTVIVRDARGWQAICTIRVDESIDKSK